MQMHLAGTGLVAVDDILGDFLRRERFLYSVVFNPVVPIKGIVGLIPIGAHTVSVFVAFKLQKHLCGLIRHFGRFAGITEWVILV